MLLGLVGEVTEAHGRKIEMLEGSNSDGCDVTECYGTHDL